ncbi:ABC transporter substrate-binding protein [Microbacterium sp. BR1]|uniref:ABC transporter substrate-binding protein n=1 Tax=Microbacterium sp. BR1 TaxID=1070896 RepID=UPI000C2C231E|nr:extracellular solute-binding protein [Microbacterium sp. BR1]
MKKLGTRLALVASAALLLGGLTACADTAPGAQPSSEPHNTGLIDAAKEAATAAMEAAGADSGGSIRMVGVLTGGEEEALEAAIKPFEQATGIEVDYEGSFDAPSLTETAIQAGNPPDIVDGVSVSTLQRYIDMGIVQPLNDLISEDDAAEYGTGLTDSVSKDGKLYAVWSEVDNFMVWYNADNYSGDTPPADWAALEKWSEEQADDGTVPWCNGLELGPASGSPGSSFIESLLVGANGDEIIQGLVDGSVPFTDPRVKAAFETWGKINADPAMVYGGPENVVATSMYDSGLPMFADPASCELLFGGVFMGAATVAGTPEAVAGENLKFFPVPASDPANAGIEQVQGHVVYSLSDNPQALAFVKYWSSAEAQSVIASKNRWVVGNLSVPHDMYSDPNLQQAAARLQDADEIVVSGKMLLPAPVLSAFRAATVKYVQNPAALDDILAEIEASR